MLSRRQIREAVVQFLYGYDLEGGADPVGMRDAFWDFVTESDRQMLVVATFRTVKHLALGREDRIDLLDKRIAKIVREFSGREGAEVLMSGLERILELERSWSDLFVRLDKESRSGEGASVAVLENGLADLFRVDRALQEVRSAFCDSLEEAPAWRGRMEPVVAAIRRMQRISDRVRMLEDPERFPDQADLSKIRQSIVDLKELRECADRLIDGLMEKRSEMDARLAAVVENFSPERLNPVDRAILRLACYEAHYAGTPVKVAINEAIELARRFGTTDSPRFVNGVLDRLIALPK